MIKLFRKGIKNQALLTSRSTHGWDAPPPPVNTMYEHKRLVQIDLFLGFLSFFLDFLRFFLIFSYLFIFFSFVD